MAPGQQRPLRGDGSPTGRHGIRTAALSVVALVGLAVVIVGVLITSLRSPEETALGTRPESETSRPGTDSLPAGAGGPAITGTISLAPELTGRLGETEVLFIIARRGPGPPFAVKRILQPRFPLTYRLGPEDVMMAGMPFDGEVSVSARLTRAGGAGPAQPGDLEGEHPARVTAGARGVDILIRRVR